MNSRDIVEEVEQRLGFLPPFFEAALDAPVVLQSLWQQTCNAYLDNPLPALFKEKLAALLARYCPVPYCLMCHSHSLLPLGMSPEQVLTFLQQPPPGHEELQSLASRLAAASPLEWPERDSWLETAVLKTSVAMFLHRDTAGCREQIRRLLPAERYASLQLFLAYNRTCLTWAEGHPELSWERDRRCAGQQLVSSINRLSPSWSLDADSGERTLALLRQENAALIERLRREEEHFRALAELTPQMLFSADPAGNIVYFNQRFYDYTGMRPEQLLEWNWKEQPLHHPDDLQRTLSVWETSLQTGEPYEVEYRLRRHDGVYRWFLGRALPVRNEQGEIVRWLGTNTDVHDLRDLRGRLSEAVRAASLGFWEYEIPSARLVWSEELRVQYGFPEGQLEGTLDEIMARVHPDDRSRVSQALLQAQEQNQPFSIEFRVLPEPDQERWLACRGRVHFSAQAKPVSLLGTTLDITGRVQAAEQLRAARDAAQAASEAKSVFLANISHELRTPLGAVLGFTELLRTPDLDEESFREFLSVIERNTQQLSRIINDILDLSKVEAGRLELEELPFSLTDLLADQRNLFGAAAANKGLQFTACASGPFREPLVGDSTRLRQVFLNLIGNAIKFTSHGEVSLEVRLYGDELHFLVKDTGVGLTAEQQKLIFQPFQQADSSTTRRFGGTGLGLVLSRELCRLMGGDLRLEWSEPGRGSQFQGFVRVAQGGTPSSEELPSVPDLEGVRILLAEDSPDLQELVRHCLTRAGAELEVVDNGLSALEKAVEQAFTVILLDLQMPQMDGLTTVRQLRQRGYDGPVLAFTANLLQHERERCLEAGFSGFLSKPVRLERLVHAVAEAAFSSRS